MPPRARSPQLAWTAALLGALILHAALLLFGQRVVVKPPAQSRPAAWHVSFRTATAPAPAAAPTPSPAEPTAPAPVAEPLPPAPAPLPPSPRARPVAAPQPEAPPQAPAPEPPPPKPERPASAALPDSARTTSAQGGWLEATHADHSPVPIDNEWRLSDDPWPTAHPRLMVQLWISSRGVIERYEVQGEAANDRAVQALLAPFMETPMEPARIGRIPVPSTMRVELWKGDGAIPNFVGPLAPNARPRR